MKTKMMKLLVFCMFAGLVAVFITTASEAQQEDDQRLILLIKIGNINQFLSDAEKLMPPNPASKATQQLGMLRGMLQGTDWIDPERSIVAGLVLRDTKINWVAMIPFRAANASFQKAFSAIAGDDYYMMTFPPQQEFVVSPVVEESLINTSIATTASNLVVEAAIGKLLDMVEPQMEALFKKMEASQSTQTGQSEMSPQQIQAMLGGMLKTFRQVEILRLGLDVSDDIFTLQFDIDALPNTFLAGVLIDLGGNTRLMDYQIDMPLQFRSRAYNMSGAMELQGSVYGQVYRQMGIDFDEMVEITKSFTGEMAGGMKVSSDGIAWKMISVLKPGIVGEDFVQNTFLPWFERYNLQVSDLVKKQTGKSQAPLYERTTDSVVAGLKVMGVKMNLDAMIPPDEKETNPFNNQLFEMRMAAAGDLMFIASDDAKMEDLINRTHSLVQSPAQGPFAWFDMDLGSFIQDIRSMKPSGDASAVWPDDLGNLTMRAEMQGGSLATRTSFKIDDLRKLMAALSTLTTKNIDAATPSP